MHDIEKIENLLWYQVNMVIPIKQISFWYASYSLVWVSNIIIVCSETQI